MRASQSSTPNQGVNRTAGRTVILSLGKTTVSLQPRHVELLVDSLGQLGSPDGDAVAEEVSSLALAGVRIDLRLSAGELGALATAILRLNPPSRQPDPILSRLLVQVREEQVR